MAKKGGGDDVDEKKETEVAVQALRLNTLSKLTFSDCMRYDRMTTFVRFMIHYRVTHLLADLGWVDLDLGCSTILLWQ